jgi:hypothetical protein
MKIHMSRRLFLAAAVVGALALFAAAFFVALTVRSVVAGPSASPGGPVPNPGHAWTEIQDHGIDGGDYWLGTIDMQALELRVNGERALRLEPNDTSPNVIGGLSGNAVTAGVVGATIGGGGEWSGTNWVTDHYGTVGGGVNNQAGDNAGTTNDQIFATVGGGGSNTATGNSATVGGGYGNTASDWMSTVGGGDGNTASGGNATVGGGNLNTASNQGATIAGGSTNNASGWWSTVGGGQSNNASGEFNPTVGGGESNTASGNSATVGGGNTNTASNQSATVGGGASNIASGDQATVGGGGGNTANGVSATVGGGDANTAGGGTNATVGGGHGNIAGGSDATVGGGNSNTASGNSATVPGGSDNTAAGDLSFAAGRRAMANYQGCFVWADATDADIACNGDNRFVARASGGVYLYTSGDLSTGAYLAAGSGSWSDVSDRNLKENFTPVDGMEVLTRLAEVPVATWNYKAQDDSIRHMGPMSQDVYAAFGLGDSDTSINTVDADGVALAAIQGLYELSQEQAARIDVLETENADLQQRLDDLETRVTALEGGPGTSGAAAGPLSGLTAGWLALGGLVVVAGLVLVQRRRPGGRS